MIIQYTLQDYLINIREKNIKHFDNRLNSILNNIHPTILFKISNNIIDIKNIPVMYINSIKNTLDELLKSKLFDINTDKINNENSLINLMFKSFSLEKDERNSFLNNILKIKIEYKEDLFFYSKSLLNSVNSRIKLLYQDRDRHFYKINYNSNIHTNSSLELFNNLLQSNHQIEIINNPSALF